VLRTKRNVLQMNCLSSEDLNEERNCSLILKTTLNPHACPIFGGDRLRQLSTVAETWLRR
jgi:hypothetical protein